MITERQQHERTSYIVGAMACDVNRGAHTHRDVQLLVAHLEGCPDLGIDASEVVHCALLLAHTPEAGVLISRAGAMVGAYKKGAR